MNRRTSSREFSLRDCTTARPACLTGEIKDFSGLKAEILSRSRYRGHRGEKKKKRKIDFTGLRWPAREILRRRGGGWHKGASTAVAFAEAFQKVDISLPQIRLTRRCVEIYTRPASRFSQPGQGTRHRRKLLCFLSGLRTRQASGGSLRIFPQKHQPVSSLLHS